jgi:hypothetical protein
MKEINQEVERLMKTNPLPEWHEPTTEDKHKMMYGLAQMYANDGFRLYMEFAIQSCRDNQLPDTIEECYYQRGRLIALKELYNKSKSAFEDSSKLKTKLSEQK